LTDEHTVAVNIVIVPGYHGAPIVSYNIEIDDGFGGDFREVQGQTFNNLSLTGIVNTNIVSGVSYRLRYRARNEIGFGEYSEVAYILTASKPVNPTVISVVIVEDNVVISW
jgi:hypothetical protein